MDVIEGCWDGNVITDMITLPESNDTYKDLQLIPLPGGKSNIWKFYGMYSKDGVSILPQHSSRVYCMVPGCPNPEMVYCGNTTNLYGHLQRKHPDIEMPEKRFVRPKLGKPRKAVPFLPGKLKTVAQRYARRIRKNMVKYQREVNPEPISVIEVSPEHDASFEEQQNNQHHYSMSNALSVDLREGTDDLVLLNQDTGQELHFITPDQDPPEPKTLLVNCCTQTNESTEEEPIPVPGLQKHHVTEALLDLMVSDLTGEQLVQRPGFQAFVNTLYPRYIMPTLDEAKSSLRERYSDCRAYLRQVLDSVKNVSVSVNQWTSKLDGKKNMIISASYLDADWILNQRVLANVGADYCSEEQLRNVLAEYNLLPGKVVSITSNALLGNVQSDVPQLPCFESALDEALQSGFEHGSVEQLHKIFLNSAVMTAQETPHTKWTSIFQILDNIVRVSSDSDSAAREVHTLLGNILKILNLLDQGSLSGASVAIPLVAQISSLYLGSNAGPNIQNMKREVSARLQNKFRDSTRLRLLEKCTFLDPRFKDSDVFQNKSVLTKEILDEMQLQIEVSNVEFVSEKNQFLKDLFRSLPKESRSPEHRITSELELYLNCPCAGFEESPTQWWKNHQVHFPSLSSLAKKYLIVPLKTKKTGTGTFLSHRDAELLLFLNSNNDLTKKLKKDGQTIS